MKNLSCTMILVVGFAMATTAFCSIARAQAASERSDLPDKPKPTEKKHFPTDWLALTLVGQASALADCDATLHLRHNYPHFIEYDPLARPFVYLPAPAYVATTVALGSVLNAASFKMNRASNTWIRRFWWVPQTIQIGLSTNSAVYTASWPAKMRVAQNGGGSRPR
jgi:hypothetical protein